MKYIHLLVLSILCVYGCKNEPPDKKTFCESNSADTLVTYYTCGFDSVRIKNGLPIVPDTLKMYRAGYDFVSWGDAEGRSRGPYFFFIFSRVKNKHVRDYARLYLNDSLSLEYSFGDLGTDSLPGDHFSAWTNNIKTGVDIDLTRKEFDSILQTLPEFAPKQGANPK